MKVNKSNKSVKHFPLELLLFYSKKKKKKSFKLTNNFSHPKLTFANEEFFFFFFGKSICIETKHNLKSIFVKEYANSKPKFFKLHPMIH